MSPRRPEVLRGDVNVCKGFKQRTEVHIGMFVDSLRLGGQSYSLACFYREEALYVSIAAHDVIGPFFKGWRGQRQCSGSDVAQAEKQTGGQQIEKELLPTQRPHL